MKNKFKLTTEEAFAIGKLEGLKEAFAEIHEIVLCETSYTTCSLAALKIYLKARLRTLNNQSMDNPFKRDTK